MVRATLSAAAKERIRGMVELRDCVRRLINLQTDERDPDSAIHTEQETLNRTGDYAAYGEADLRGVSGHGKAADCGRYAKGIVSKQEEIRNFMIFPVH